nr:ORFIII polyprotein [Banana streak MY virus]QVG60625.1 ORFIII polyprotein [Banana streak MY virus]
MTTRRSGLPTVTETMGPSTSERDGTPLIEDQIRDYRASARRRYEAQRVARNIGNMGRRLIGRQTREDTLALLMDPEVELQRSMRERARTVPAEVLYMSRRDDVHHRVYHFRSKERMMVSDADQQDRTFISEESYERLQQAGLTYIHLGVLQVRFQILHRTFAGTMALLVFRDTRWTADDRSIISAMEVDLAEGNQLVYVIPNIMMTIGDFYRHIQISIRTRGYDSWEGGEANLLITRSITARLSNTSNVGFAYQINRVAEYLRTRGVKAIDATKHDARRFQHGEWNLRPSTAIVPVQPTSVSSAVNYDRSISLRFGDYQAASSSKPPVYNQHDDEIDSDEESFSINMVLFGDNTDYPMLQELEKLFITSESMVGEDTEEGEIQKFLDDEETIQEFLNQYDADVSDEENYDVGILEEYPELFKLEEKVAKIPILSEVTSQYRPADVDMAGPTGYTPATSQQGLLGSAAMDYKGKGSFKWKSPTEYFNLPSAQQQAGAMFVMPANFDPKIFERWESITLNHMADKVFSTAEDKLIYLENLLGEAEKVMFQSWRMTYASEYEEMKGQALGNNGTQNLLSQIRRIFYLEDPKTGTTVSQDAAYKAIKSLVCQEMTGTAIKRYMADYWNLAAKTGRIWQGSELSDEFFTKLPNGLGDRIAKAFKEKYPGNTVGVPARITFTQQYLEELCREAAYQRSLKNLDFCREFPIPGYYKRPGRKFGVRKSTSYKGKPHKTHIKIDKRKYLRSKKCKCYACGEEGHYASECRNPRKLMERVSILQDLELSKDMEVVSVEENETELSDIYSISEGEDSGPQKADIMSLEIFMLQEEIEDEPEEYLVGATGTWRNQMRVSRKEYYCQHDWDHSTKEVGRCKACTYHITSQARMRCTKCKLLICNLCMNYCYGIKTPEQKAKEVKEESDWKALAANCHEVLIKYKMEKEVLLEELNNALKQAKEYKEKVEYLEGIREEQEEENKALTQENQELKERVADLESECSELKEQNSEQGQKLTKLQEAQQQTIKEEAMNILKEELKKREQTELALMMNEVCTEKEYEYEVNTTTVQNNLYNIKIGIEVDGEKKFLNAILDTGAATCVVSQAKVSEKFLEPSAMKVELRGVNGTSRVNKVLKEGKIWIGNQYFRLPRTYAIEIELSGGIDMIIGTNFLRAMSGGVRIEGETVTFYKIVTTTDAPKVPHQINIIEELEMSEEEFVEIQISTSTEGYINKEIMDSRLFKELKEQGYIGEEPLRHWQKNMVKCKLELKNPDITIQDKPLKHVTSKMRETMKAHIDKLLQLKVIRPSSSRHRTTAMIVESGTEVDPKTGQEKRGKERLVFNFKRLNDNTEKDQYSLPGINTIISRIGNAKIYSKFDLKSGFHQVAMDPESIPWTAFLANNELYEWLVMPFGLKNAPAIFQRKMDTCFKGTEAFIAVYIDDILVFSENEQLHKEHLRKFLEISKANGLILSPTKMKIGVKTIDFLGASIGNSKIKLQPHIIKKIADFDDQRLKETKGLRAWLGILNYARNYIPNLGKTLGPLYSKISPNGEKRMNSQDWVLVNQVKKQVQNLPELELPPENCKMVIETDGCMEGWGGVCKWTVTGKAQERVCAYASGKFTPIKSTIDAEVQAVINSLDKFKIYYLDKKELLIRTDCEAIVRFYKSTAQNKPSRVRWLMLTDFISGTGLDVKFEHINGNENVLADSLSRLVQVLLQGWHHQHLDKVLLALEELDQRPNLEVARRLGQIILKVIEIPAGHQVNMVTEGPKLQCACGKDAEINISHTSRNPDRPCQKSMCHIWIWKDLVDDYFQNLTAWNKISETHRQEMAQERGQLFEEEEYWENIFEEILPHEEILESYPNVEDFGRKREEDP